MIAAYNGMLIQIEKILIAKVLWKVLRYESNL